MKWSVLDPFLSLLLLWEVILDSVYLLSAGAPVEGAFSSHGPDQTGNSGRAPAQPQEYQRRNSPELPYGHHWSFRLGQILARLRHHLCRRPAPLRRIALRVRAAVPRPDGAPRSRRHRRAFTLDRHRTENDNALAAF